MVLTCRSMILLKVAQQETGYILTDRTRETSASLITIQLSLLMLHKKREKGRPLL